MADKKISALPASTTPLAGTEVLPIVQSGATKQVSVADLTAGRTQTSNGVVQGAAGTGYNFTANTPAAGMTSQLLNWYEEGTFTPTVSSNFGALTSYTANGTYTRIGNRVCYELQIVVTDNGTGSGSLLYQLPFTQAKSHTAIGVNLTTFNSCLGSSVSDTSINNYLTYYNGLYPVATGQQINISGTYRV
jgi:hypothetical protein